MKRGWILFGVAIILVSVAFLPSIIQAVSNILPEGLVKIWFQGLANSLLAIPYPVWLIVTLPTIVFLFVYFVLAPNNCFFTFVQEGTAKFVVRGDKFQKCLIQWEGHTFDYPKDHPEKWDVVLGKERHLLGGLRFYGIWPIDDIHIYRFRWTSVTERGEVKPREEWLDYILLKDDVYLCKVSEAEDKNLLPLDLQIFLTIRVINPYKAKFAIQDWLETVINRMQPLIRQYVAKDTYENLLPRRQGIGEEIWNLLKDADLIGKAEEKPEERGEFINRYGTEVRAIEMRQINPPETWRTITLKKYEAEREAEATIAKAKGEMTATVTRAEGEVERLKKVYSEIQNFGDLGKLVRTLEAVEKSPLAASLTIQAIPGLPEILRGIFAKPAEEVTLKEFRELRELVEKLLQKESAQK